MSTHHLALSLLLLFAAGAGTASQEDREAQTGETAIICQKYGLHSPEELNKMLLGQAVVETGGKKVIFTDPTALRTFEANRKGCVLIQQR